MGIGKCRSCGMEYSTELRRGRPGRITDCEDCAQEDVDKYTGVMIYSHKTCPQIQINTDPSLTQYIINSTKLQNKGSNLGNNLKVGGTNKGSGRVLTTTTNVNAKGKAI